jgi:hypothetical protein
MGWKVVVVAVPPHMRPPPHVSLCLQLPLMVLVLGWGSRWKEREDCAGWWWSGRWLLCGWQCCCCCFCCSCLTVCRALDVDMHSERCCLCTRSEPKPTTTLLFSSPQVGLNNAPRTGEGNNQHRCTLLQARWDVGTGHTSLPPCRWNSRRRPTEHNHDRRELGGNLPLEQQSRCWGVKAGFSCDPWRLVRVLHPHGPWVQAAFERGCRSACTCHHLWVQISGFPS